MSKVKYEPIYGLQKPFDDGPEDATAYGMFWNKILYYKIEKTSVYCFDTDNQWSHVDGAPNVPFLAMRRIINPPVWTKADEDAGKLPDVGAIVITKQHEGHAFEGEFVCEMTGNYWCIKIGDKGFSVNKKHIHTIEKPIETPAEKAQRLRSEWVETAIGETPVYAIAEHGYSKQLRIDVSAIYDALISGELKAPTRVDQS